SNKVGFLRIEVAALPFIIRTQFSIEGGKMNFRISVPLFLLLLFLSIPGFSQTFRGSIAGTVTDPSGAAMADVTVTAVNTGTGLRRDTQSTAAGEFTFQDLPPGSYEVTASQTGFDRLKMAGVTVE